MPHFSHMNNRDKNSRYSGTFVSRNGRPFLISEITESNVVSGKFMHSQRRGTFNFDELDSSPPRLGFMNGFEIPTYVVRKGSRFYKQGLSNSNLQMLRCFWDHGMITVSRQKVGYLMESIDGMSHFNDMMTGTYPSFSECLERLNSVDHLPSQAFCREFTIFSADEDDQFLLIGPNCRTVGKITDNGEPELDNEFNYYRELLEARL